MDYFETTKNLRIVPHSHIHSTTRWYCSIISIDIYSRPNWHTQQRRQMSALRKQGTASSNNTAWPTTYPWYTISESDNFAACTRKEGNNGKRDVVHPTPPPPLAPRCRFFRQSTKSASFSAFRPQERNRQRDNTVVVVHCSPLSSQ